MKTAKIKCQRTLDKQIKLIGFEDIASADEIVLEYDLEVARIYKQGHHFYRSCHQLVVKGYGYIDPGKIFSRDEFADLILALKKAARRLKVIREKVSKTPIIVIKI